MTNERAIELLNRISDSQFDGIHGDERREALSMAVRALEGDGDTISRQEAIDAICKVCCRDGKDWYQCYGYRSSTCDTVTALRALPTADVRENLYGKWEQLRVGCRCSECFAIYIIPDSPVKFGLNFCPNCGARMEGESE